MPSCQCDDPKVVVSVIVPTLNESGFFEPTIESILSQDFPSIQLEILVVDGGSTDGTLSEIEQCVLNHSCVRYISNPHTTVPYALNLGIREARGDIVMRMDCHSVYPYDYISTLVSQLDRLDADNVGGVIKSLPPDGSCKSEAIATALSSPYGVGNSSFRIGSETIIPVDTVPFGCYPRNVFERIGEFDVSLTRNQDDEFNARLRRLGGTIYLIPGVEIQYYTRRSLKLLFRMFFQYGLFKPLSNRKSGVLSSYRQLAPPILVLSAVFSLFASIFLSFGIFIPITLTLVYSGFLTAAALSCHIPSGRVKSRLFLLLALPTIHFAYGMGYWMGIPALFNPAWTASVTGTTRD
ncbi:MAG: glycosyltransferase family 2 protein [Granulosicoccus sp.]